MSIESITHSAVSPASTAATQQAAQTAETREAARILPTGSIFDAVGVVLDLSSETRDALGAVSGLEGEERNQFLEIIASVLNRGVVGTETLEVNGQPYESFATTRLGDPRLMHAKPYYGSRLDVVA